MTNLLVVAAVAVAVLIIAHVIVITGETQPEREDRLAARRRLIRRLTGRNPQ